LRAAAFLLAAVLLAACNGSAPPALTLEAMRVEAWRSPPRLLIVALPGKSDGIFTRTDLLGAGLRRDLAACGIESMVVTDVADPELSLEPDSFERDVAQASQRLNADGVLRVGRRGSGPEMLGLSGPAVTQYLVTLTETATRRTILGAAGRFTQYQRAEDAMPGLSRLLVRNLVQAGAMRCVAEKA
jgi:CBS domain-containing protein